MHRVEHCVAQAVTRQGNHLSIGRVGVDCPGCGRSAWFDFGDTPLNQSDVKKAPRAEKCPGCDGSVYFYVLDKPQRRASGWLWVHPSPKNPHSARGDVAQALDDVAPALGEAYQAAAAVLADGRASAAATEARRTLEGLVKHRLKQVGYELPDRPVLAKLIEQLATEVDLASPLTNTAHAVRDGGNLEAHFDTRVSATPELATETLQLVEAVVDYLLILPNRVKRLRDLMDRSATAGDVEDPEQSG